MNNPAQKGLSIPNKTGRTRGARRRHFSSATRRVEDVCGEASTTAELIDGLRQPFNDALGLSGMVLSATDPQTTAFGTATVVEHLPEEISVPWMHNEYMEDDVNKFATLHRTGAPASTLDRATQGRPELSPRYRRLHQPYGFGHELRATFSEADACWGVANLVREAGVEDFDDDALRWLEGLRPTIASGIRRTTGVVIDRDEDSEGLGIVNMDPEGVVLAMNNAATRMLADLWLCPFGEDVTFRLPGEAYMIVTLARARARSNAADREKTPPAVARLQSRSGRWLTIRGDYALTADGELSNLVLLVEPSRPAQILPLVIAAYGLTAREREVLSELSLGSPTSAIANRLFISEHTVRDHVKSILAKTETTSRGELISLLF